jgi:hypothetical protein
MAALAPARLRKGIGGAMRCRAAVSMTGEIMRRKAL